MPDAPFRESASDERPGYAAAVKAARVAAGPAVSGRHLILIDQVLDAAYPIIEAAVRDSLPLLQPLHTRYEDAVRADERRRIVEALREGLAPDPTADNGSARTWRTIADLIERGLEC